MRDPKRLEQAKVVWVGLGIRLIHKVERHAFVAVEKSDELAIVGRGHVVVDGAEIPMIGNV